MIIFRNKFLVIKNKVTFSKLLDTSDIFVFSIFADKQVWSFEIWLLLNFGELLKASSNNDLILGCPDYILKG